MAALRATRIPLITTTLKTKWLDEIVRGVKPVEYREIKSYWTHRFKAVGVPFDLRLISGMYKKAPEVTVRIARVRANRRTGDYELHIAKVLGYRNWNKRQRKPTHPAPRRERSRRPAKGPHF